MSLNNDLHNWYQSLVALNVGSTRCFGIASMKEKRYEFSVLVIMSNLPLIDIGQHTVFGSVQHTQKEVNTVVVISTARLIMCGGMFKEILSQGEALKIVSFMEMITSQFLYLRGIGSIVPAFLKELICKVFGPLAPLLELNQFGILLGELRVSQVDLQEKLPEIFSGLWYVFQSSLSSDFLFSFLVTSDDQSFTVNRNVDDFLVTRNFGMILGQPVHTADNVKTTKFNRHKAPESNNTLASCCFLEGNIPATSLGLGVHSIPVHITSSGWPIVSAVLGQMTHLVASITLNSTSSDSFLPFVLLWLMIIVAVVGVGVTVVVIIAAPLGPWAILMLLLEFEVLRLGNRVSFFYSNLAGVNDSSHDKASSVYVPVSKTLPCSLRLAAHELFVATLSCYRSFSLSGVPIGIVRICHGAVTISLQRLHPSLWLCCNSRPTPSSFMLSLVLLELWQHYQRLVS
ncbi:hypothetical protein Tco_1557077 [Tanacetum coccineum]